MLLSISWILLLVQVARAGPLTISKINVGDATIQDKQKSCHHPLAEDARCAFVYRLPGISLPKSPRIKPTKKKLLVEH
jgi:hypothetical protein